MSKKRRNSRLGDAEIALAMELRSEGVSWKLIGYGLSVRPDTIHKAVRYAEKVGMKNPPSNIS